MKTKVICFIACAAVSTAVVSWSVAAESEAKSPSQHSRFAACAHESKGLRGDDHQNFMSECLKGNSEAADEIRKDAPQRTASDATPQHHKMKACNDEAGKKNLHGDERRAFMSSCLKD
jgi:Spy/CpxP family protein refolding chaperone